MATQARARAEGKASGKQPRPIFANVVLHGERKSRPALRAVCQAVAAELQQQKQRAS